MMMTDKLHYRIEENVGRRNHWRIQMFGLFGEENQALKILHLKHHA